MGEGTRDEGRGRMRGAGNEGVEFGDLGALGGVGTEVVKVRQEEVREEEGFEYSDATEELGDCSFEGSDAGVGEGEARWMHGRRRYLYPFFFFGVFLSSGEGSLLYANR